MRHRSNTIPRQALALGAVILAAPVGGAEVPNPRIDCAFPGGNVIVESIENDTVILKQDRRDTEGWWFYWYFRIQGAAGRTLNFKFTDRAPVGVRGPAISLDEGLSWEWLGKERSTTNAFCYAFGEDARSVRFSFGMPYTETNLGAFLKRFSGNPALKVETLCQSRKGRPVEFLRLGCIDGAPQARVFITCRHHCCEMMASYAVEGIAESVLTDDDAGRWFREHVAFGIVSFVDKDGVEDGDQGKNRRPHDHNRDYGNNGIYAETRAIRALLPRWSGGHLCVTLDLHCPSIRGGENEHIYQVGKEPPEQWARQQDFGKILEDVRQGPLPYKASGDLPFGQKWNTAKNYAAGTSFCQWAHTVPGVWLATSFEIPYANVSGFEVTARTARYFGHDIARALRRYLEQIPNTARVTTTGENPTGPIQAH